MKKQNLIKLSDEAKEVLRQKAFELNTKMTYLANEAIVNYFKKSN